MKNARLTLVFWLAVAILPSKDALAEGEFESDSVAFITEVFDGSPPAPGMLWLDRDAIAVATDVLGHKPAFMRLRYWGDSRRSAWIVDEVGKTEPITIGVVIKHNVIEQIRVLAFRESRGWEIKHEFFTRQYHGLGLNGDRQLSGGVDGISGATLSVRAMNGVSRLVLYLAANLEPSS